MASITISTNVNEDMFLPWVESASDRRFKRILILFVTIFVLISAIVPFIPVPEMVKKDLKTVSPRISKLIRDKQKVPPPEPAIKKKTDKKPTKKEAVVKRKQAAYKKAASSGLLALSNELSDLKDDFDFSVLDTQPLRKAQSSDKILKKDFITANAVRNSSGIKTDDLTRTTSVTKLSGRKTTSVTSEIADMSVAASRAGSSGRKTARSEREIEQVFQKNKGAIYSIYNRALRKDPTLEGKMVVELTVSPNGKVIRCRVVSSELSAPALERKIVSRIKMFKFSAANVLETTVKYPIDFLPS